MRQSWVGTLVCFERERECFSYSRKKGKDIRVCFTRWTEDDIFVTFFYLTDE